MYVYSHPKPQRIYNLEGKTNYNRKMKSQNKCFIRTEKSIRRQNITNSQTNQTQDCLEQRRKYPQVSGVRLRKITEETVKLPVSERDIFKSPRCGLIVCI